MRPGQVHGLSLLSLECNLHVCHWNAIYGGYYLLARPLQDLASLIFLQSHALILAEEN